MSYIVIYCGALEFLCDVSRAWSGQQWCIFVPGHACMRDFPPLTYIELWLSIWRRCSMLDHRHGDPGSQLYILKWSENYKSEELH